MDEKVKEKIENFFIQFKCFTYKKGEIIIRADDNPSGIYFLQEGVVRTYYISKRGQEVTLNMFKPGAFFPMSWAISNIHNRHYFEAMTNCITYQAPKRIVLDFLKKEPDVLFDLIKRMYIGIEGLWMHIEYLASGNALEKLIVILLILGKRFGKEDGSGITIQIKLTEQELGDYAGMYRETISRELQTLKQEGLVSVDKGTIIIHDLQKLEDKLLV